MARDRAARIQVLIADDDARVRTALRAFLSALPDFEVIGEAASAAAALQLAREHRPTVALVDVLLPDARDGLDLLRTLTVDFRIPVVAISIEGGMRSSALAAGAYRFLDKDGSPELLVDALLAA
jgi:DNA-binding NarL/FixJ family response regulator